MWWWSGRGVPSSHGCWRSSGQWQWADPAPPAVNIAPAVYMCARRDGYCVSSGIADGLDAKSDKGQTLRRLFRFKQSRYLEMMHIPKRTHPIPSSLPVSLCCVSLGPSRNSRHIYGWWRPSRHHCRSYETRVGLHCWRWSSNPRKRYSYYFMSRLTILYLFFYYWNVINTVSLCVFYKIRYLIQTDKDK